MTAPLSDLYLRDCRERLESSEHMDPIEWAERAPSLLGEIERLRAEADETTGLIAEARAESAAWAVEGAEMRDVVHRLTKECDEAKATIGRQADRITWLTMQHRGHDWTPEVERLRAEVERLADAYAGTLKWVADLADERDAVVDAVGLAEEPDAEVLTAPHRCDCCSVVIEPGDSAVMFIDETGRECWAHYGACPEPDPCRVTYDYNGEPRTTGDISEQQAIYFGMAMNVGRAAGITRVRLVRCKEPRRG